MEFTNLGDLIDSACAQDKSAIIDLGYAGSPREYSYSEFDALARGSARALLAKGLKRGTRVALLGANSAEYFAVFCGIMLFRSITNFQLRQFNSSSKIPARNLSFLMRRGLGIVPKAYTGLRSAMAL